jgi:hypothetical protein
LKKKKEFESKTITVDDNYIFSEVLIHIEDITIACTYVPNMGTPKYMKQFFNNLQKALDCLIIINTPFLTINDHLEKKGPNRHI